MNKGSVLSASILGLSLLASPGCVIIADIDGDWGARVWRESTEEVQIQTAGLSELEVRSHNGKVSYDAAEASPAVSVTATKKGGGRTVEAAEEALAAIEVYAEDAGNGVQRLGWRWQGNEQRGWQGSVAFAITGPSNLALDVETHNGEVLVGGVSGAVAVVTHNGAVNVDAAGPRLRAESHNGAIKAKFAGEDVALVSHNGEIEADLLRSGPVGGSITTHNGGIEVGVAEGLASELNLTTDNGRIRLNVPNSSTETGNRHVKAAIGGGGPPLAISTHNGGIKVQPARG